MKRLSLFLLLFSGICFAQTFSPRTDTFTFDKTNAITSWNGSDPSSPPYPYDMGSVSLVPASIYIPWQLGYLNNGQLQDCDSIVFGPKVWTVGDGTHSGDTYTLSSEHPAACPYYTGEYGASGNSANTYDSFSVTVTYVRQFKLIFSRTCPRGCKTFTDTEQGGTGTAEQVVTQQVKG